jgi:hypothetical protein
MSVEPMRCGNCDAQLAPGATWCSQCFTPVAAPVQPAAASQLASARQPPKDTYPAPEFSRWKGGHESFGPVGRIVLTIGLLIGLFIGYFIFYGGMVTTIGEIPVNGAIGMYSILAIFLGGWGLKTIWKRARIR